MLNAHNMKLAIHLFESQMIQLSQSFFCFSKMCFSLFKQTNFKCFNNSKLKQADMNNCHIFCSLGSSVLDFITFRGVFSENIKYHIQGLVKLVVLIIWNNFYLLLPQFHLPHPCLNSPEGCLSFHLKHSDVDEL